MHTPALSNHDVAAPSVRAHIPLWAHRDLTPMTKLSDIPPKTLFFPPPIARLWGTDNPTSTDTASALHALMLPP
ncbi:Uncharacterised protein [Kytococcus sedentarius]|nr:Uncharacterised protein [Kytococcus sedentarius]